MSLSKTMPELLLELLQELESIGIDNEEIYNTVCREKMSSPIWSLFIRPTKRYKWPDDFGLYSDSSNHRVKQALQRYIDGANQLKIVFPSLVLFQNRLAAFQDYTVETESQNQFANFFGFWFIPEIKDKTWHFQYILRELMQKLENIAIDNPEIYTSEFREQISDIIWKGFVLPSDDYKLSDDFALSNDDANREVKQALQSYIQEASTTASSLSLKFYKRLVVFQDRNISTYPRRSHFDDFFKWRDPNGFDASGKWFGVENNTIIEQERSEEDPLAHDCIPEGQLCLFDL
jgi:hypothetical protein